MVRIREPREHPYTQVNSVLAAKILPAKGAVRAATPTRCSFLSSTFLFLLCGLAAGPFRPAECNPGPDQSQTGTLPAGSDVQGLGVRRSLAESISSFCAKAHYPKLCEQALAGIKPTGGASVDAVDISRRQGIERKSFKRLATLTLVESASSHVSATQRLIVSRMNKTSRAGRKAQIGAKCPLDQLRFERSFEQCQLRLEHGLSALETAKVDLASERTDDPPYSLSAALTLMSICLYEVKQAALPCVDGAKSMLASLEVSVEDAKRHIANVLGIVPPPESSVASKPASGARRLLASGHMRGRQVAPDHAGRTKADELWADVETASSEDMEEHMRKLRVYADIVVAKTGPANFRTINDAVHSLEKGSDHRQVIHIKAGVYNEQIKIPTGYRRVSFVGDGADKTIISFGRSAAQGYTTSSTATLTVFGHQFGGLGLTIQNTAGNDKGQAVAFILQSDKAALYACRILAFQDTLWTVAYRSYFRGCIISGTVDTIFGNSATVVDRSTIYMQVATGNQNAIVAASGREYEDEPTGFVVFRCKVLSGITNGVRPKKGNAYLGRPWFPRARTVIIATYLDSVINPLGWFTWDGTIWNGDEYYAEYRNQGPGSDLRRRAWWAKPKTLTANEVINFLPNSFIHGNQWVRTLGVPYG